jgi:thiol-disulfide isomerase/thioredoxin
VSPRWSFAGVALLAVVAGIGLWTLNRPAPRVEAVELPPDVLYAMAFRDTDGKPRSMGEFRGDYVVLNFWASWCAPCREEMPGFSRLASAWKGRGVRFVGVTGDDPHAVERFLREVPVSYPVFLAGEDADRWARRLGDRDALLPFTVIVDPAGRVVARKVGVYSESEAAAVLAALTRSEPPK